MKNLKLYEEFIDLDWSSDDWLPTISMTKDTTELLTNFNNCVKDTDEKFFIFKNSTTEENFSKFRKSVNKCIKLINKIIKRDDIEIDISDKVRKIAHITKQIKYIQGLEGAYWIDTIDNLNKLLYKYDIGNIKMNRRIKK